MAVTAYLKFTGPDITGESTEPGHIGEIQVLSWSHIFNQPTETTRSGAGGGTIEQAGHDDFSFSKYLDTSTDDLLKYCWNGKQINKGTLTCYGSEGDSAATLYLQIDLEEIIVSNVSIGGGQGDLPTENISLAYSKVRYACKSQNPDAGTAGGAQPSSHDLIKRAAS